MHRLPGTGWFDQLLWQREGRIGALGTNKRRFVRGKKGAAAPQAIAHQDTLGGVPLGLLMPSAASRQR
jgi:hypothetical protein